jgi:hypothetical protein
LQITCKNFCSGFLFCHANPFSAGVLLWWLVPVFVCQARIAILTTFAPVDCFAANIAGDVADMAVLVPPNAGPHDYSFSPADIQKIAKADVLIMNGAGLKNWLQRGIKSAGRKGLLVVDTSKGLIGLLPIRSGTIRKEARNIGYVPQQLRIDPAVPLRVEEFLSLKASKRRVKRGPWPEKNWKRLVPLT